MGLATAKIESADLFETLANKSPVGICIIQDGRFCYTNPTFQHNTGYTEDELLGRDSLELIIPEDQETARENTKKMLKEKLALPSEFRVIHKDDSIHWVAESVASVQYNGRQAILATFVDITEQKQTEEALQAERNKLQSLINAMEDTITIQDTEYTIIYQNEQSKIASGGDHLGEKCYRAYEGRETVCDGCPVKKAFKDGKSHIADRMTTIGGEVVFWENTANPIRDAQENIVACLELARDITERKQAEEKLKLLSSVTQQVTDATMVTDTDFNITYVNRATQDLLGYSPEEMLGKHIGTFNAEPLPKILEQKLEQTVSSGKQWVGTLVKKRKDGSTFLCECHINPLYDEEGKISSYIDVLHDITERKRAEEALQSEKNKLQSLIDAMDYTVTIQDAEYNIIFQNELEKIIYGDHPGEKCYRIYAGREKKCDICPVEESFKDGKPHTVEKRNKLPSGKVIFWEITSNPIRDAQGRFISCLEIGRDITERKRAEEALQSEKNKLQSLIDAMVDALNIIDKDYNIIYQNEPSKGPVGGDHRGEKCYRVFEGRENICEGCPVEKAFKDGKSHTAERQTTIAGDVVFWENTANPVRDANGRIVACLEIVRNITQRKQEREALQTERNKLQSVINAMEDGFSIMDRDYNITYQNETSKRIWGEHKGEKCYRIYESREKLCERCPVEKAFKDGKSHTTERRTTTPSGEVIIWENTANPIKNARGEIISCLEIGRNVTDSKKQEQALADELAQRRLLIDKSLDGIVVLDEDAGVVDANQCFADMLGYTLEEVRKLHTWDWDKNFSQEQILEMGQSVDEKGLHLETKHTCKDGSVIDVDISISGIMYGGRKLIFCIQRDITERKQAREALQTERNKLQSLIDAMEDGLTIQDREYNIIYMNGPSRISSGGDRTGEKCYRVYEGRENICEGCPVEKAFKDGKTHTAERQRVLPSGELSFWENTANPIRDARGKVTACLELGRDITERKKQEQVLADELTRRRLLIDQSVDGIVVMDENDKVYEANQRFADMLGYTLEEVHELHTWDWDKNYSPKQLHALGTKADEKGFILETTHTRKDGSIIDVDISINASIVRGQKLIFCVCRDITERKKAERALADELTQRRLLIDKSLDGIVVLDEDAGVVDANQCFADMLGYTLEEVRKLHTWDWDKNFSQEQILEMGQSVDEKGLHLETKHTRKDGSVIDVDISISGIMCGGQKLIFCIQRDITERKKMEEAVRQSEENYRALFDSTVIGTIVIDAETKKLVMANKAATEMLGFSSPEEFIGLDALANIPPEDKENIGKLMATDMFEQDLRQTREFQVPTKDGREIWISASAAQIIHDGKMAGLACFTDITERKRAEEAIRRAAEEWRETFDSITDAISIHDRDFKILRANKAFADIFHKKPSQIIGRHCYEIHKGNKPHTGCPHKHTLATKEPAAAEFYESNMGKYLLESTSPIFDEKGEVVGTVHITRDITEQKQQSERLMMADRLASIGELAAGTAHELNNPLTSVIGFSQLLMEKDIPDDVREDLKIIYSEAQRAAGVTGNLLAFARKHAPVKQLSQINNIIDDVLKLRAYEQKVNGIKVERQLAPDLPETSVDYFQMQQVFLNIIINAEYFMAAAHNGGTLTITTQKQDSTVMISISDDGPGISKENLRRIFDPFYTSKEAGKGTGLGLSICHGIVTEHGGQIYARSKQGKGATITVELPIDSHRPRQEGHHEKG